MYEAAIEHFNIKCSFEDFTETLYSIGNDMDGAVFYNMI